MSSIKVSALTAKTTPSGSEELLINDGGTSKKITIDNVTENNFTDTLKSKLDAIEASATADQTGAEIKTAYQAEANAYTDTKNTKLSGIATSANNYVHPNHSGDVTSTADGATVISTGAVDIAMLSATGTAGATNFLRGDNTWVVPTDTNTTYTSSDFTHDDLTGFVANEHIDWTTDQGATNIHAGNYTDTNTTYSVGDGGLSEINFTSADNSKLDGIATGADVTSANETSHADVLVDGDVGTTANKLIQLDGTAKLPAVDGSNLTNMASGTPEGTAILSTGEAGGTKFLREDGDGTSSWQSSDPTMGGDLSGTASNAQIGANTVTDTELNSAKLNGIATGATNVTNNNQISNGAGYITTSGANTSLSNLSSTGEKRVCHVWVHFKGTSTVAIQDSYNVSSVTDNGSGDYTVNFSITMANDNFSWSIGGTYPGTVTAHRPYFVGAWSSTTHSQTLSTTHIRCAAGINYQPGLHSASLYDAELVAVSIFGD